MDGYDRIPSAVRWQMHKKRPSKRGCPRARSVWLVYGNCRLIADSLILLSLDHLLEDVSRDSVLVNHEVHCVGYDVVLCHVPDTLVVACLAPRVLHHVVFLAMLVLSDTEDKHAVVVA